MSKRRRQRKREYNWYMKAGADYRHYMEKEPPRWKIISHWIWKRKMPKWMRRLL